MTKEQHKQRHLELHKSLDELVADYIEKTGKRINETNLWDLIKWSNEQTKKPTE